jgi:hypothetical protein
MIEAYGGNEKFEAKLDELFNSESKTTGREQVDVTGLIGQYAHGNEPSHHMAYLYNYVGKPEKTTEKVHYILNNFYKNTPDGLIGNEDCGQMSAWYVLSSMGIYAVSPGMEKWEINEPFLDAKVSIDGNKPNYLHLPYERGILPQFGWENIDNPSYQLITPVPVIQAESKAFRDKMKIEIKSQNPDDKIYYFIQNPDESFNLNGVSLLYKQPLVISKTSLVRAFIKNRSQNSDTVSAQFFKKPNNYTIDIKSKYNPQYHAGGPEGLIDGINGSNNWRKGEWQGYQSQDFEAVIDLQKEQIVHSFSANCLQDSRSWILFPSTVEYYVSNDNVNFTLVGSVKNEISPKYEVNKLQNFEFNSATEINAKYIKVKAYNFGKLPEWHQGFGGDAFIFIDEITIK